MFSPPGVDGVLPDEPSAAMQPALPGRAAASLALCGPQCGKRLTTRGPMPRFVAPRRAPVNVKLSTAHIAIPRSLGSFRAEKLGCSASLDLGSLYSNRTCKRPHREAGVFSSSATTSAAQEAD